jgi:hypothetical protein
MKNNIRLLDCQLVDCCSYGSIDMNGVDVHEQAIRTRDRFRQRSLSTFDESIFIC